MPRTRWWVIAALSVVTLLVVLLDVSGVIFEGSEPSPEAPPLAVPEPADPDTALAAPLLPVAVAPDQTIVSRVDRLLRSPDLGASVHAVVTPLAAGDDPWLDRDGSSPATPASTIKLWTAAAVLDVVPAESRLPTSAIWDATTSTVTVVGTGDATLVSEPRPRDGWASLADLARQAARRIGRDLSNDQPVRVAYDASAFTGPAISPRWEPTYVSSGVIAPVTALMVDQGRVDPNSDARWPQPDRAAAQTFARLLVDEGVPVRGTPRATSADPSGETVATVRSPQVGDLVERMLRDSDNQLAEALGRIAAAAAGEPPSFVGAASSIRTAAERAGADLSGAAIYDASGLSRDDALPTASLIEALSLGATSPDHAPILSGLAVAGFDGTLADRFSAAAASGAGIVRAKTGTLTGVTAEAGVVTSCSGDLVAFAFVADAVPDTEAARSVLDAAAATLGRCPASR